MDEHKERMEFLWKKMERLTRKEGKSCCKIEKELMQKEGKEGFGEGGGG